MSKRKKLKSRQSKDYAPQATPEAEEIVLAPPVPLYRRLPFWIAVAVAVFLAIYLLRMDRVVGMMVDDAWYVLLAKALATGQGFRIINSPGARIMPLYPPGFPFLLSLVFRIAPGFPENYWLLKSVSIAAMLGAGALTFIYCRRYRELPDLLSLLIAFVVAIAPPFAYLATSTVMSECVFTLAQLGAILLAERAVRAQEARLALRAAFLCALVASYAFLVRSMGVGLLLAVLIYFAKERLVRPAILFAAVLALCLGPWMIYSRLHAPALEQRRQQGGHIVEPYTEQFWQSTPGDRFSNKENVSDLPGRVWKNTLEMAGDSAGELMATALHYPLKESGGGAAMLLSWPISLLILLGYWKSARQRLGMAEIVVPVSLAITLLWPWPPARLVLPLLPFWVFYFLAGLRAVGQFFDRAANSARPPKGPRDSRKAMAAGAACLAVINLFGNGGYIAKKHGKEGIPWIHSFDEHKTMLDWMRERLPKEGENAVATNNPPLVHLYTGHKSVTIDTTTENWDRWKRLGVRYFVRIPLKSDPVPPLDMNEGRFNLLYRSTGPRQLRVIDLGPSASRRPWNRFSPESGIKFDKFN